MKKDAFCGTRGIPSNYGGFETAVDEISKRFVTKGYDCDVFCRSSHSGDRIDCDGGRNLVYVRGSRWRQMETFISSIQTGWYVLRHRKRYQHIFWFNNANFPGIIMTLFSGVPITINTDGLEWQRKKWGSAFKLYYFLSSAMVGLLCRSLISDSRAIQDYYRKIFRKNTIFIPYGIPATPDVDEKTQEMILETLDLRKGKFLLQITRIEPDNLPLEIAQSFQKSNLAQKGYQFIIVGFKDETPYASQLYALNGRRGIVVLPANYDQQVLYTLRRHSFCYVHGNSVGGTNPALLEAMATCSRILAIDVIFSREVLGEQGHYFTRDSIDEMFLKSPLFPDNREKLRKRAESNYQWDAVAESYMAIAEGCDYTYRPINSGQK